MGRPRSSSAIAPTTATLTVIAWAAPYWARWLKYTVVTTAEPIAAASC